MRTVAVKQHQLEMRLRKNCSKCGKRRLTTRCTLEFKDGKKRDIYLCNPCLVNMGGL